MQYHKYFIHSLRLSIIFAGLSVSVSQFFLFLSAILMFFDKPRFHFTPLVKAAALLFAAYLFSFLLHWYFSPGLSYAKTAWKAELKDIMLFFAFLVMQNLKTEDGTKIKQAFYALMILLVATGFVSIFSRYRLSRLVTDLYMVSGTWPFQHHQGTVLGIHLYLPIGFMNTHLTFGGLLLFFYPFAFFDALQKFSSQGFTRKFFASAGFFLVFSIVFLMNNARSAFVGAIVGILLGLYHYLFIQKKSLPFLTPRLAVIGLLLTVILGVSLTHPALKKVTRPLLGEEKHTDSGRTFIWHSTLPLIAENPLTGVGPGNYRKKITESAQALSPDEPGLLYFYEITRLGHAHNDLLHILAISGAFGILGFLLISFHLTEMILKSREPGLFLGLAGFFFAGLLQCYFQDDEVVIVFWFLAGFMSFLSEKQDTRPATTTR